MKKTRLNPIGKKRMSQLPEEYKIREELARRCGGKWIPIPSWIQTGGYCEGGWCELCGKLADYFGLHPHERKFRSHGGKLSLVNSLMLCQKCHDKKQAEKSE